MEDKKKLLGALVVIGVVAALGWPYLQWFRFELEVRDAISDKSLGRFPSAEQIVALPAELARLAKAKGFDALTVEQTLREVGAGPTSMWYLELQLTSGSHTLSLPRTRRIESRVDHGFVAALEEAGIPVERAGDE